MPSLVRACRTGAAWLVLAGAAAAQQASHWAFTPPQRVVPPAQAGSADTIDAFVGAALAKRGQRLAPPAAPGELLRRVTLDLTGLPPTPEAIAAFEREPSEAAYLAAVDRLLASHAYAERMAWPWLQAARYADTDGYQNDPTRGMWAWRDWLVEALHTNLPFDRLTEWMLAGDLLPEASDEQRLASGFLRNGAHNGEGGRIAEETRVESLFDRTETVGTVWLGLTMECARCHDHKHDPISQREYYALAAYFDQTSETGAGNDGRARPTMRYLPPAQKLRAAELRERLAATPSSVKASAWRQLGPQRKVAEPLPLLAAEGWRTVAEYADGVVHALPDTVGATYLRRTLTVERDVALPISLGSDDGLRVWCNGELLLSRDVRRGAAPDQDAVTLALRTGDNELLLEIDNTGGIGGFYFDQRDAERQAWRDELAALERQAATVLVMDSLPVDRRRTTRVLDRGAYDRGGAVVGPGVPTVFGAGPQGDDRLALARWLTSPANPLAARVAVNRAWQTLFGRGLVTTPDDFGTHGAPPSHPELLDWLAVWFVDSGWDAKALHRLIVTSATYRQTASASAEAYADDPDNVWLARGARRRLPSWLLRDQALALGGLLVQRVGGPPVRPYQPDGVWEEATFGQIRYVRDDGEALYRRSLYTFWRRIVGPTNLFDEAPRQACTVRESRTNSPLHALVTWNDEAYVEAARAMAGRATAAGTTSTERIAWLWRTATARPPTAAELDVLLRRHEDALVRYRANPERAAALLSVGAAPPPADSSAVELAALAIVAAVILNTDEVLSRP
ncbi:MAG: hypothetical protein RL398_552 [Planctomycetota bacterium]